MRILIVVLILFINTSINATGNTPGSYTQLVWPQLPIRTSEDYTITVKTDPGPLSNVFWSNQFAIGNYGGYTGMQATKTSNGNLTGKLFLFSVWGATQSMPGSSGSWCISNTDGSPGQSCRYIYDWIENHTYNFHLSADGNNWYSVIVSDVTDKNTPKILFTIGKIYLPNSENNVMPGLWVQWTEYFEWNDSRSDCQDAPYSSVIFSASSNDIAPVVVGTSSGSTCQNYTNITYPENCSISTHTNGLGNSQRLTIQRSGLCLNAAGGLVEGVPAILYPCGVSANQLFVYASDNTIRTASNYCLTYIDSNNVKFNTCDSNLDTQKWIVADGQIISFSSKEYLTANANNQVITTKIPTTYFWLVGKRFST